ncbi:ATP-binding protein [Streptomyces mirabilis]
MGGRGGWWRGKSTPAKVETYTRWSFHTFPFIEVATFALPTFGYVPAPVNWILFLLVSAHAAVAAVTASLTLDWTRGRRPLPVRLLWALGTATVVIAVVSLVVALKSELAVQLARRGRPEAVEQMVEVQRIARETQREVREVVRGYREADLRTELAGAQGVLTAAGIDCEVSGPVTGLPAEIQSALGWVVREATTNVLRHGDAARCAVSLRVAEGRVTLTVENDGAPGIGSGAGTDTAEPGRGSGLAGLRERLREVDGVLRAGPAGSDLFRLTAEVPLPPDSVPEQAPAPEPGGSPRPAPHPVSEVTS